jgi:hypothetical protein
MTLENLPDLVTILFGLVVFTQIFEQIYTHLRRAFYRKLIQYNNVGVESSGAVESDVRQLVEIFEEYTINRHQGVSRLRQFSRTIGPATKVKTWDEVIDSVVKAHLNHINSIAIEYDKDVFHDWLPDNLLRYLNKRSAEDYFDDFIDDARRFIQLAA